MTIMPDEFYSYPRKMEQSSITRRQHIVEKMSNPDIKKLMLNLEQEISELSVCSSKLSSAKLSCNKKSGSLQEKQTEIDSDLKMFRNIIILSEKSKNILEEIIFDNNNLAAGYSKTSFRKHNNDIYALIRKITAKLMLNTNQTGNKNINILPAYFDHIFIKNEILKSTLNQTVPNIDKVIKKSVEILTNTKEQDICDIFGSLSHFGYVLSSMKYNKENVMEKFIEFIGSEELTSWREINYNDKENLSLAFNNLIKISLFKDHNSIESIIPPLKQACNFIELIIESQILSLSKKETEIGIKNTLLTVLILSSIIEPFLGLVQKMEENYRIEAFDKKISKFKENIFILKANFQSILNKSEISDEMFKIDKNYFLRGIKLLVESVNFTYLEKEDFLFIRKYYKHFGTETVHFNNYVKNLESSGFSIKNYNNITDEILSYLPKFHTNEASQKRNFTKLSDFFIFFKQNPNYVNILNEKICLLISISNLSSEISDKSYFSKDMAYIEILEKMIANINAKEISFSCMNLISFFIKIIDDIQEELKRKEKLFSKTLEASEEFDLKDIKVIIDTVLERIEKQRLKHNGTINKSAKEGHDNYSLDDLISLIVSIQREIQFFNSTLMRLISELEDEIEQRKSIKNINHNQPYNAPKKNIILQENKIDDKEILKNDDTLDIRKTLTGKIDISEILKNINAKI